ncbi:uncharacterized protein LOC131947786 [Physella acuta]|uniref:uncharacterized protein LOC131947786 n=1 Tax=Physella acuta TaxID=109671 RepID=UPI0027DE2A43|nr:uncharacterized protein LOC131947786 [Physella acuta]
MKLLRFLVVIFADFLLCKGSHSDDSSYFDLLPLLAKLNDRINHLATKFQNIEAKLASGEEWTLAFRGTANVGKSVFAAYRNGTGIPSEVEPGCKQVTEPLPCSNHYRNKEVFDSWDRVEKVAFIVYSNYTKVKEILFDGSGSTYMDWFNKARVKFSTWNQIKTDVTNFFSIEGYIPVKAVQRTFFVNSIYNGCPNDKGWFVAIDIAGSSYSCDWETTSTFPVFKYARQNQAENWTTGDVGIADMFAIFVKYYDMP